MSQINQLFFQDIVDFLTENRQLSNHNREDLDLIAKSYYTYIIYLDKLLDNEIPLESINTENNPLYNLTQHHELCVKKLIQLFGNDSPIFESKSKYSKIYFDALYQEKKWDFDNKIIALEEYEQIAVDKHIPVFFIVDGIQLLCSTYPSEDIKKMLASIFRGIQMYDDFTDIGEDLTNKQFTYIISQTINYLKADDDYHPEDQSYTHKAFFALEELCNPQFDYMINQFLEAKEIALAHKLNKIVAWIDAVVLQIREWKLQIDRIRNGE